MRILRNTSPTERGVLQVCLSIMIMLVLTVAAYGARVLYSDLNNNQTSKQSEVSDKDKKKSEKSAKAKKQDDDDDDDDGKSAKKSDKKENVKGTSVEQVKREAEPEAITGLSAEAKYINLADAIKRARSEGGSGDVVQLDLEWDQARSVPTWDVTFASGNEYEIDALTGKVLATKPKSPAKLSQLSPLPASGLLSFQEIIRKASSKGQSVMEMELKQMKGRPAPVFEVVMSDSSTLFFDAKSGSTLGGI